MSDQGMVDWVFSSTNTEQLRQRYDTWAGQYDADLVDDLGYIVPEFVGDAFTGVVPLTARILDAGVGTGLMGEALAHRGYTEITGIDLSQGMLDQAAAKGVYVALRQMELGAPLDLETDYFDAMVCIGTFAPGHAPPSSLDELVRVTKPGGALMFALTRGYDSSRAFGAKMDELTNQGLWELVTVSDPFAPMPIGEPDVLTNIWHYRAC